MNKATTKIKRHEVMKIAVRRLIRGEKGQALVLVLILLLVGGLVITPLLDFMGTGLMVGKGVYENKMYETYAADAGVEHALSLLKYDVLADNFPDYDEYDYFTQWDYNLNDDEVGVGELVNNQSVQVTIGNVWMPKDIPTPDKDTARQIIEGGKLMISGGPSAAAELTYEITLTYAWTCGEDLLLDVDTIGIWLPPGINYTMGSSDLEQDSGDPYYCVPVIDPYNGGYAVVWDYATPVRLSSFPGGNPYDNPMIITFTFQYDSEGQSPDNAVSWIDTSGVADVTYTWDADVRIFKITSVAGGCEVEAYAAQIEMRKLGAAMQGDYHAVGGTLMTSSGYPYYPYYRNRLYKESSGTVDVGDIPSSAFIEAAWLYWSGWIEGEGDGGAGQEVWSDNCDNFGDWTPGSHWSIYSSWGWGNKEFMGQGGGSDAQRTLTMHISGDPNNCLDLSPYSGQEVTISWDQRESQSGWGWPRPSLEPGDCLKYAFSGDGGASWSNDFVAFCDDNPSSDFSDTIPDIYLTDRFKMRFFLDFDETNEYCYIDDITIFASAGSSLEDAKVNRVMFNGSQITADWWQTAPTPDSGAPDSWSYSCYKDVTQSVRATLDPDTKSGTFTLGHVLEGSGYNLYPSGTTAYPLATPASSTSTKYQWTYAGWSLVIIYSSPETKGHQLYHFDTFRYVGLDTQVEFSVSGFLAPDDTTGSHLTYFVGEGDDHYAGEFIEVNGNPLSDPPDNPWNNVFNSYSNAIDDPVLKSGIDVDTYDMSGYIDPGAISAEVLLDNGQEIYDLVYIILSFRSEITSGGSISYLIKG